MGYKYLILGAGRQGTAAAFDLARYGDASDILMADINHEQAQDSASRINHLTGLDLVRAVQFDVRSEKTLPSLLHDFDVALSAVPYYFNLAITRAAIQARTSLCDLGGLTAIVKSQLELDSTAREAGISVVPDCGMGPGLVNTLGAYVIELLDEASEVFIYDGGLPQHPKPPWNYELTFHINGLTNEMDGQAVFIRDSRICFVDTLSEVETIDIPPLGLLEADVTSGGTSTAPWTYLGKLCTYENKVLRYPGHFSWLRAFKTLGLFSEEPVRIGEVEISPRLFYHTLLEPKIFTQDPRDICVMRAVGKGLKKGEPATVTVDLIDRYDSETGFTGMERLTGWHCSIMMIFQALKTVKPGVLPVELAIPASKMMAEFTHRGIPHTIRWQSLLLH
jgi:lysine 6-dehydrogenase